jgi:AraC family transcriptional regulator, exoenzyme S synthesis regulatory protein ExsA
MINFYDYVKTHPEENKQFSSKELLFLMLECPPEFEKSEDWSAFNCFLYVLSGEKILFSRERSWHLREGTTIFLKKGGIGIERAVAGSFCALMFYFPDNYIRSFMREINFFLPDVDLSLHSKESVLPVETNEVTKAFYDSVLSYFSAPLPPSEYLLELKFRELLFSAITNPANTELIAFLYKSSLHDKDDLREVMERNFQYDLHLEDYSRLCQRSLSTFKRDFLTEFGIAPGHWLQEKRLEVSRQLLLKTHKTIWEIAGDSGFKNSTHFSKLFKTHFGLSPLQFRKQQISSFPSY